MNLKAVFYGEVFINLIILILCTFAPEKFFAQLVTGEHDIFTLEFARWYGLVLLILSGILLMALRQKTFDMLRLVLIVNLPGDILQIALAIRIAQVFNQWSTGLIFTVVICVVLFAARVAALAKPKWAGY